MWSSQKFVRVLLAALISSVAAFGSLSSANAEELSRLIPYPFYAVQGGGQNRVMYVDDGISALTLRVDMIRRAKRSIVAEYFIFNTDTAGRIISKELIAAAQRGVSVRLLIDKSSPVFEFDEYFAKEMSAGKVSVRYYNAARLWRVSSLQFRTHRKLLAIDDLEALTGGRNIADDYFDLSPTFNFDDADIHVVGPIAKVMRQAFDRFFDDKISERPSLPKEPWILDPLGEYKSRTALAKAFFLPTKEEIAARMRMNRVGAAVLRMKEPHVCETTTFSTDAPGATFLKRLSPKFVDEYRFLRKTLFDKISAVDRRIIISSPYMIDGSKTEETMNMLLKHGAAIDIYTNSLASTDATYVAANMYLGLKSWSQRGIKVFLHDGRWIPKNPLTPAFVKNAKAGTHSKVQVYLTRSYSEVMVGTYNVDHRSNYYNAEMALFCKGNDRFTQEVVQSIANNTKYGLKVHPDGTHVVDRNGKIQSIYGATESEIR